MTKQFLFLAGRIAALQSRLLTSAQIDRMIGSTDAEAAFRILTELQYAEYLDANIKPAEFARIIDHGLQETKKMIADGTDNAAELEFVWGDFDLNNLKKALKDKLVHGREALPELTEENGYSALGEITAPELEAAIFTDQMPETIALEYANVIQAAKNLYEETQNFLDVELLLDEAYFTRLATVVKTTGSAFLGAFLKLKADLANALILSRLILSGQTPDKKYFLPRGQMTTEQFLAVADRSSLEHLLETLEYYALVETVKSVSDEDFLVAFERAVAKYTDQFLFDAETDTLGAIQVPMVYFLRRIQNARAIKFIMYAKFYGIASEKIYQTLHHL